jgi:DNA-binding response OmpR family regulator
MTRQALEDEVSWLRSLIEPESGHLAAVVGNVLDCTPNTARVALRLYQAAGRPVSRDRLILSTLRVDHTRDINPRTMDVFVWALRRALGEGTVSTFKSYGWALTPTGLAIMREALTFAVDPLQIEETRGG